MESRRVPAVLSSGGKWRCPRSATPWTNRDSGAAQCLENGVGQAGIGEVRRLMLNNSPPGGTHTLYCLAEGLDLPQICRYRAPAGARVLPGLSCDTPLPRPAQHCTWRWTLT